MNYPVLVTRVMIYMMMILLPEKLTNQYRKCNEAPLRIHSDAPSTASSSLGPPGWERSESAKKLPARWMIDEECMV